jgi:serine protease Do
MSDARTLMAARQAVFGAAAAVLVIPLMIVGCTRFGAGFAAGGPSGEVSVPSFAPLVQEVLPAVVNVAAVAHPSRTAADFEATPSVDRARAETGGSALSSSALGQALRQFLEQQRKDESKLPDLALGSGFIIDPRGYIVTDDHVLENATAITVTFHDGTTHSARIIGRDPLTDLALLKIDAPEPLPYVRWGDSDNARVGDWVLAIGNPFGLDDTVSSGIISARSRDIHSGPYDDFLQIDAAINRGNSGGPTFNLDGAVIGINTAIYSPNGGSVGIGFAIPANLARPVIEQLEAHGAVERGWLGVEIQPVTPEIAQSFGLAKATGALVAGISAGGPAARAGFEQGDVVLSVNGHDIERMRDLPLSVAKMPIGQPAEVMIWRQNRTIGLRPVIDAMPASRRTADLDRDEGEVPHAEPAGITAALKLAALTPRRRTSLRIGAHVGGVVVTEIGEDSPFAGTDLLAGDVIETINRQPVASPADAFAKLDRAAAGGGKNVLLLINRHGSSHFLAMSLADSAPSGKG